MKKYTALLLMLVMIAFPATADTTNAPTIKVRKDCFDAFPDHQAWADFMREKNGFFKGLLVSRMIKEADFKQYSTNLNCNYITYESDGILVPGFLIRPKNVSGKLPTIIYNRGGNGSFGAMNFTLLFSYALPLADQGFAVFISQYRGLDNKTGPNGDQFGGKDVQDVLRIVEEAKSFAFVDEKALFMLGVSRGAMMTMQALANSDTPFKAIATVGGLVDLIAWRQERPEVDGLYKARIPHYGEKGDETLIARSATYWPEKLPTASRYLFLHGEDDDRVHWQPINNLAERLITLGADATFKLYEGDNHTLSSNRKEAIMDIASFFKASLNER